MGSNGSDKDEARLEALCRRCGKCCREKIIVNDVVYASPVMCVYYDSETGLCTVYERRHEMNPDCLDREAAIAAGVFPEDCPYVAGLAGYVGPVEGVIDEDVMAMIDSGEIRNEEDMESVIKSRAKPSGRDKDGR